MRRRRRARGARTGERERERGVFGCASGVVFGVRRNEAGERVLEDATAKRGLGEDVRGVRERESVGGRRRGRERDESETFGGS